MKKTTRTQLFLLLILFSYSVYSQCGVAEVIDICNMQSIDFNNDGSPDGIINLYDEYQKATNKTLEQGTWSIKDGLSLPLNKSTGEVSLWEYKFSSAGQEYVFEYFNSTCGDEPALSLKVVLGSFSGVALQPFKDSDVNLEVCDSNTINLFEALASNETTPSPHLNGIWELISSPNNVEEFVFNNTQFVNVKIKYQPGIPLIDKGEFEFKYTVPAVDNCPAQETMIKLSVVRQVNSGEAPNNPILILDTDIINGVYDNDIDLRDNEYLINEDDEGIWLQNKYQDDENDSTINIKDIYNDIIDVNTHRFKRDRVSFAYGVNKRSGVCEDSQTEITFLFVERLRPIVQIETTGTGGGGEPLNEFCNNEKTSTNLFDLIKFTIENGNKFVYDDDRFVNWRYLSGPTDLNIIEQPNNFFDFDPTIDYHLGKVDLRESPPGTYKFRYAVSSNTNNPDFLGDFCDPFDSPIEENYCNNDFDLDIVTADITIVIKDYDYAGENTDGIELCETAESVFLISVLKKDNIRGDIDTNGVWVNADGDPVTNEFDFPQIDADQTFNFTYTTTNPTTGCIDTSTLEFTIINEVILGSAGESSNVKLCSNNKNIRLFDELGGAPDAIGMWTGPNNYVSNDHIGEFVFNNQTLPALQEGVYTYTVGDGENCTSKSEAIITIQFVDPVTLTGDIEAIFCKNEGSINLYTLLSNQTSQSGIFTDTDNTNALNNGTVTFATLTNGNYNFEYSIPDAAPCDIPTLNVRITVLDEVVAGSAGTDTTLQVCSNDLTISLFDQLGGSPEATGTWAGPFGYVSVNHVGAFEFTNPDLPRLTEGVYTYTVGGGQCSTSTDTATVTIQVVDPIEIGNDINITRCKLEGSINLFSLLDNNTTRTGTFIDTDITGAIAADGTVDFSNLTSQVYNFLYSVENVSPCVASTLNVELKIIELPTPKIEPQEYCILDGKRLNDIEVDVINFNWYRTIDGTNPIIDNPRLLDDEVYYIATTDSENCESERVIVPISILNIGELSELGKTPRVICPLDLQDGVTPDGNNENDTFELVKNGDVKRGKQFNIPEAFPDFSIEIFNRYGTIVYKGDANTQEFNGISNVSLSIGDNLPSGVYYYVLNPNFKNNAPVQGSFYLSK